MSLGNAIHNELTNLLASLTKEMQFMRTPAMVMAKQRQINNVEAILDTIEQNHVYNSSVEMLVNRYRVESSLPAWAKRLERQIDQFNPLPSIDEPRFSNAPLIGWDKIGEGRLV